MAINPTRGQSLWLPNSKVLVCVKPGEELTNAQAQALDEFFMLLKENRDAPSAPARDRH